MSVSKKILMLGGSAQQVPAINAARELGYYTVLIDYLPDNPGQYVADRWYPESTTDVDTVYKIAKDESVSGILPYASDPAALPAAIVAEKLGLPTNPAKSVEILGVKHKFRQFLQDNGFSCPSTYIFSTSTPVNEVKTHLMKLSLPIMIKPTDSSGSKGITRLRDYSGLDSAIRRASGYSRNKVLIAEEYIERGFPYMIGGDIFVENGKVILYGDMACIRTDSGTGLIPTGKKWPNGLNDYQAEILHNELQRIVTLLDIKAGELNIELLLDKDDKPHFIELGPRAGGNMIPIQLSDAFGIDLIKANVLAALGLPVHLNPVPPAECYMTHVLHTDQDGIFDGIEYSAEIQPYIYRKVVYKHTGDRVERFDGAGKAIGIIFMKFPDTAIMNSMENNISEHIKIRLHG